MVRKTIMDCGLTVISQFRPEFPSVALSYTLKSGSGMEKPAQNGIHHFIEHLLFKGSERYSMAEIAETGDRLGGYLNAFTGKEVTQYYLKTLDENVNESLSMLTDMVFHSLFARDEFEREKNVVLQEIRESEDNPDSSAFENFYSIVFNRNPMGQPIAGTADVVENFTRDMVFDFYRKNYVPEKIMLSAVGNIRHEQLLKEVSPGTEKYCRARPLSMASPKINFQKGSYSGEKQGLKQAYVILGFPGISITSQDRYAFMLMNDILGGGVSSRLFQTLREKEGLAYTVSSFHDAFMHGGLQLVYGVVDPENVSEFLRLTRIEIEKLSYSGISDEELERARDHLKSSLVLGLESNLNRMRFNTSQELYWQSERSPREIISGINAIDRQYVDRICRQYLNFTESSLYTYGPQKQTT